MRIVSWNCKNGFEGKKAENIKEYKADILVIPECRKMDMKIPGYDDKHRDWYGDHKEATDISTKKINEERDLGIGVFWKDDIVITQLPDWEKSWSKESNFRYLVPYSVKSIKGFFKPFTLIAVWTKDVIEADKNDLLKYVQKAYAAIDHYKSVGLLNDQVVLVGDFNTFAKNDKDLEKFENKLEPLINCAKNTKYWEIHTYYHGKDKDGKDNTGIDDFCFASKDIVDKIKLTISDDKWDDKQDKDHRWNGLSDHCPIIVDFDLS
jgi:exonuclease III